MKGRSDQTAELPVRLLLISWSLKNSTCREKNPEICLKEKKFLLRSEASTTHRRWKRAESVHRGKKSDDVNDSFCLYCHDICFDEKRFEKFHFDSCSEETNRFRLNPQTEAAVFITAAIIIISSSFIITLFKHMSVCVTVQRPQKKKNCWGNVKNMNEAVFVSLWSLTGKYLKRISSSSEIFRVYKKMENMNIQRAAEFFFSLQQKQIHLSSTWKLKKSLWIKFQNKEDFFLTAAKFNKKHLKQQMRWNVTKLQHENKKYKFCAN